MTVAIDIFTIVAISAGSVFFMAGTVGLLRFPDSFTRLHALTKADNLGLGLIVLGLLPQADGLLGALKLVAVWVLVQLAGATVAQLIAHALRRNDPSAQDAICSLLMPGFAIGRYFVICVNFVVVHHALGGARTANIQIVDFHLSSAHG